MNLRGSRMWMLVLAAAVVLFGLLLGVRSTHLQRHRTEGTALEKADAFAAAGHLQQAQDAYLDVLLSSSLRNPKAMEGLVSIRRRLAHDDPAVLRRQARAYLNAASRGIETPEHYTAESMRLLAAANLLAAARLDASSGKAEVRSSTARNEPPGAGGLRDAQDKDLAALLRGTADAHAAMQRLVGLRRRIAHDDPALLRRQARTYLDAANRGIETSEHYAAEGMRLLAAADLLAALQVEAEGAARYRPGAEGRLRVFRRAPAAIPPAEEGGSRAAAPPPQRAPRPQSAPTPPGPQAGQKGQPQRQGISAPAERTPRSPPNRPAPPAQRPEPPSWAAVRQKLFPGKGGAPAPQPPPQAGPTVVRVGTTLPGQRSGKIEAVDCARGTFTLRDGSQRYAYTITRGTALYLGPTRLRGECPLKRFVGSNALVWSTGEVLTNIAGRITIVPRPSKAFPSRAPVDHEQNRTLPGS